MSGFGRDEMNALLGGGLDERLTRNAQQQIPSSTAHQRSKRKGSAKDVADMTPAETAAWLLEQDRAKGVASTTSNVVAGRHRTTKVRQYHQLLAEQAAELQKTATVKQPPKPESPKDSSSDDDDDKPRQRRVPVPRRRQEESSSSSSDDDDEAAMPVRRRRRRHDDDSSSSDDSDTNEKDSRRQRLLQQRRKRQEPDPEIPVPTNESKDKQRDDAASSSDDDSTSHRRPVKRRETKDSSDESSSEDETTRKRSRPPAGQEVHQESGGRSHDKQSSSSSSDDSSDSSSSSSSSDEEEELTIAKPLFVPRHKRKTQVAVDTEKEELEKQAKQEEFQAKRKKESRAMVQQVIAAQEQEASSTLPSTTGETMVGRNAMPDDDDDNLNRDEWEVRELKRLIEAWDLERERVDRERDIIRRRRMTDEERMAEDRALGRQQIPEDGQTKEKYQQRYYHKGAFYMDESEWDASDVRHKADEYAKAATGQDRLDKQVLPKVMRVKKFGFANQSKYKGLNAEDTTDRQAQMLPLSHKKGKRSKDGKF